MAGHGRRIPASDEQERTGRSVLPISITGRLHSNTWRQVFTSLRPLVAQTRQRTLSTYARRLHQRHLGSQTPNSVLGSEPILNNHVADSQLWQPQHSHHPPDGDRESNADVQNVVIDIESSARGVGITPNSSSIPTPPLVRQDVENDAASVSASATSHALTNGSESSSIATPSSIDPLIPHEVHGADITQNDNASASDTSSDDGAASGTNNRSASESLSELLSQFPEVRSVLVVAWHYCIFFFIILAKAVFDHFPGLIVLLTLVIGFVWSNNILKKAVARQGRRSVKPLLALLVNLPAGVFLLYYSYRNDKLFYSVLLIPPDREGLGVVDLMWIVIVSDYVLKLVTVLVKTLLTLLPHSFMHYQNRGKYFLVVEMASQLYRSLAPIQPWLSYLLDGYAGPKKVLGVILSATYMVCKGPDIVTRMKSFHAAIDKFIHSVNYRCTPSKAQLQDAGVCPICHDDFQLPTMLQCKHIFCEQCVVTWLDHERTCPMCRTQVTDDPAWRDGGTSHFLQLY